MAEFSKITITFLTDFIGGSTLQITNSNELQSWDFVSSRSGAFQVTTGTPTSTAGEITATNFEAAFNLDNPNNFILNRTVNQLEIISETQGFNFLGFRAFNLDLVYLPNRDFEVLYENFVAPINNTDIDFILVKSPHYINLPFLFTTTTNVVVELYVWSGNLVDVPQNATYTLTIPRPSINFAEFNIDISKLIAESLDARPLVSVTDTVNLLDSLNSNVKYVKYIATYTDEVEAVSPIISTLVASDGYGYYLEGINPTKPANNILTSSSLRKVARNGIILFPFVNDSAIETIDVNTNTATIDETVTITPTNSSNKFIQYLSIDVSESEQAEFISVQTKPNNVTTTYEIIDECRYNPIQLLFLNKFGVFDSLTLFKKSNETTNVTSDDFVNNYVSGGTYDTTRHQYQKLNTVGKSTIKINSGYINEKENELYKQLLFSDLVYILKDAAFIPVNIANSSIEFKTRVNDNLINYTLDLEYAFNDINNI
jgi:hypothetical protein